LKINPLASYGNSQVDYYTNTSRTVSITFIDSNDNEVPYPSNESIRFFIPRDPNLYLPSMALQNVTSINSTAHNLLFNLHYVNITSLFPISLHLEISPINPNLSYLFIYKFDDTPHLNSTNSDLDGQTTFSPSNLTTDGYFTYFLNNQQTLNHQSFIFGLREINSIEFDQPFEFTSDYLLRIYTSGCYYLDSNNSYQSNGLIVGSQTNHFETECHSSHLTTFAGGFIVLPQPINWNYVFANMDFMKNKTIYLTVIIISILYIALMIYARYKDRKDLSKLTVTSLNDNQASDRYYYQILVFTGHRKNSGTKSKVCLILSGDDGQTQVRILSDSNRSVFERGGIDAFILSVPKSLGLLNYLRIWHDNSGSGESASWFLKYIIVRDLQTMNKSYFIAQRWFAVEKDDGLVNFCFVVVVVVVKL